MSYTKRTLENLAGLNSKFRKKVEIFLQAAEGIATKHGITIEVLSGYRSYAVQASLYAQGRTRPGHIVTRAKPGSSFHNYGLAIDLGLFAGGKYLDETAPSRADRIYKELSILAGQLDIEWAGNWTSFCETPHFQKTYGFSIAQLREKLAAASGDIQLLV